MNGGLGKRVKPMNRQTNLIKLRLCALLSVVALFGSAVNGIDWNSEIVPSSEELQAQKHDALTKYFGNKIEDGKLFRSFDTMEKLVGKFTDVPLDKQKNHNYAEMTAWLKETADKFPSITHLYSAGKSVQDRELWVIVVSRNPKEHELLKPEFKYVGNMHGNEKIFRSSEMTSFAELFPRGSSSINELDTKQTPHIQKGYDFEIKHSWDGKLVEEHEPYKINMRWHFQRLPGKPHKRVIRVQITGPLFDDPEPPNEFAGPTPGLWNHEVVELFFANEKGHYLEVEVGPHGHWLVLLHKGYRQCFNDGKETELDVENIHQGSEWTCSIEIPLAYLPGGVTKFNAYAIHGSGSAKHYEALYAVTDGSFKEPDFHRTQFFGRIDTKRIIPEGYNRQAFNDMKYGDMWEEVKKEEKEAQ